MILPDGGTNATKLVSPEKPSPRSRKSKPRKPFPARDRSRYSILPGFLASAAARLQPSRTPTAAHHHHVLPPSNSARHPHNATATPRRDACHKHVSSPPTRRCRIVSALLTTNHILYTDARDRTSLRPHPVSSHCSRSGLARLSALHSTACKQLEAYQDFKAVVREDDVRSHPHAGLLCPQPSASPQAHCGSLPVSTSQVMHAYRSRNLRSIGHIHESYYPEQGLDAVFPIPRSHDTAISDRLADRRRRTTPEMAGYLRESIPEYGTRSRGSISIRMDRGVSRYES